MDSSENFLNGISIRWLKQKGKCKTFVGKLKLSNLGKDMEDGKMTWQFLHFKIDNPNALSAAFPLFQSDT